MLHGFLTFNISFHRPTQKKLRSFVHVDNKNTNHDYTHLFLSVIVVILHICHYKTENKYTKSGTKRICEGISVNGCHMMILIS